MYNICIYIYICICIYLRAPRAGDVGHTERPQPEYLYLVCLNWMCSIVKCKRLLNTHNTELIHRNVNATGSSSRRGTDWVGANGVTI